MNMTGVTALPALQDNYEHYTQLVEAYPRLDEDEERSLANRLVRENDLEAAFTLITSHLRYVVYIARGYKGYGIPQEDLIQEGNLGLMKAVRRFDPERGVRLVAYAGYWVRAQIHDFVLKNWRMVKAATTKAKRKLFYKLRGAKQQLDWLNHSQAEEIADSLGVDASDVIDMESQLYLSDQSFNTPAATSSDEVCAPEQFIEGAEVSPEDWVTGFNFLECASSELKEAIGALDSRSRDIIECRWLAEDSEKVTLQVLGERYGVSAERIRQLERAAIAQLREFIVPRLGVDQCDIELPRQRSVIAA